MEALHSDFQPNSTFKMFQNSGTGYWPRTICTVLSRRPANQSQNLSLCAQRYLARTSHFYSYLDSSDKPSIDLSHVAAFLHGDDPQVVLFTHPHKELNITDWLNTESPQQILFIVRSAKQSRRCTLNKLFSAVRGWSFLKLNKKPLAVKYWESYGSVHQLTFSAFIPKQAENI